MRFLFLFPVPISLCEYSSYSLWQSREGIIIRRNSIPCFIYAIIVAAVMAYLISKGFNPLPLKL